MEKSKGGSYIHDGKKKVQRVAYTKPAATKKPVAEKPEAKGDK